MITIVKLSVGDTIIADIENDETTYSLKDPYMIIPVPPSQIAMMPYHKINGCKPLIEVYKKDIVFEAEPNDELLNNYQEQTGRIVTPNILVT